MICMSDEPDLSFGPDVLRVIESANGTFTRLRNGGVADEFRLLVMASGAVFEETPAGLRRRSTVTVEMIDSSIAWHGWREVWP